MQMIGPGDSGYLFQMFSMGGSRGRDRGSGPPVKNHKNIGFLSNTGPDPLKNHSCLASIQCWAIIGMPAKCHLNGVSLAGRWWVENGGLIVVFGPSLPSSTKRLSKGGGGLICAHAWIFI